ncbi:hypothetical protein MZO42_05985 [Sphingomonas psychrotolerans]|uniref:Phage holin family protein n=1 Tax=Sphingomonas psychrotolerans TaxID=1327635 RepID=A0ABU3N1U5_9SPHN|nr:hypothetical protein [Sphingomonas psychrotolerans]MDT8758241.1 hypothetical protein [Sphingomonas psychrotolerans]
MNRIAAFFRALGAPFRALLAPEGRRAWALLLLTGGGVSMTVYAGVVLYLVSEVPKLAFYLGVGALLLVGIVITGFAGLLVKRDIDLNVLGARFRVTDQEAQAIADAVVAKTPPAPPPTPVIVQTGAAPQ